MSYNHPTDFLSDIPSDWTTSEPLEQPSGTNDLTSAQPHQPQIAEPSLPQGVPQLPGVANSWSRPTPGLASFPNLLTQPVASEPEVLQNLSSELASIRASINELKRNHSDSTQHVPGTSDLQRSQLLSQAIAHLANSRTSLLRGAPVARPATNSFVPPPLPVHVAPVRVVEKSLLPPPIPAMAPGVVLKSEAGAAAATQEPDPAGFTPLEPESMDKSQMDLQLKKLVRKQRNRQAAQNSRLRKKMRMEQLEENLAAIMEQNRKYQVACEELTRRNQELEQRLKEVYNPQTAATVNSYITTDGGSMLPTPEAATVPCATDPLSSNLELQFEPAA